MNILVKRFNFKEDYKRVIEFLKERYIENKNMECWLPARFDDLVFRIDSLYHDERGKEKSSDYIYIFEINNHEIVGLILPDGDSFNSAIKSGYEEIFPMMLDIGEKDLLPLFDREDDGKINFLCVAHDSLTFETEELLKRGYVKDIAGDFDNVVDLSNIDLECHIKDGFQVIYGDDLEDICKKRTCHYGFHPDDDDDDLYRKYAEGDFSYNARKKSKYYKDSFETLVKTDDGDLCCYSFCYVDKELKVAFVEPVSTRKKYRKLGLCKEMLHGMMRRLKDMGIEKAYINSYDWRVKVYNSAGFKTIDSIGFWFKKL